MKIKYFSGSIQINDVPLRPICVTSSDFFSYRALNYSGFVDLTSQGEMFSILNKMSN